MPKTKVVPNFDEIRQVNIVEKNGICYFPRFRNNDTDVVYEAFIRTSVGKGGFCLGYLSLGVVKNIGDTSFKERTTNGEFRRFIKIYDSAQTKYAKENNGKSLYTQSIDFQAEYVKEYENEILSWSSNGYHNGDLATKALLKVAGTGEYISVMHAIDAIELEKYLSQKDPEFEPYHKMVAAKNIAKALQNDNDKGVIHDDIKLDNIMLNIGTLAIRFIDYDHSHKVNVIENKGIPDDVSVDSNIKNVRYNAHEKFNPMQFPSKVTIKSEVYSTVASIIDLITDNITLNSFEQAYTVYKDNVKVNDHLLFLSLQNPDIEKIMKPKAMAQYFGSNDFFDARTLTKYNLSSNEIYDVEICAASYDRMVALSKTLSKNEYLLSPETKGRFLRLCAKGLAVDPDVRPTVDDLVNNLSIIANEFKANYLKETIKVFNDKLVHLDSKYPDFMENEQIKKLLEIRKNLLQKEKISSTELKLLNEYSNQTLRSLECTIKNCALIDRYLIEFQQKLDGLLTYINQKKIDIDIKDKIVSLQHKIDIFKARLVHEKTPNFIFLKVEIFDLFYEIKTEVNKSRSQVESLKSPIAGHTTFFNKAISSINKTINYIPEFFDDRPMPKAMSSSPLFSSPMSN